MIRLRDEAASTSHSPPLQLPSASRREDRPEVTLPPQKRLDIAFGPRYEVGESSSAAAARPAGGFRADYGFVATGAPVSTNTELGGYVREFETRVRQDTDEIYMRLDDEQTERQLLAGRLNMLFRDRRAYAYTRQLMETDARISREAWVRATDASDLVHGEVMLLRTTVLGQMSEIRELQVVDPRRQTVILELLRIDHRRSIEILELRTALQGQEEHPASADSIPPLPALRVMARISSRPRPPILFFTKEDAERFLAMPIPSPSPLTSLSSPLPQIPSPLLPSSPHILPIPLHAASPPLQLLSSDHRADRPEVTLPPRKRLSIVHCPGYEVGESSVATTARLIEGRRADYGFVGSAEAEIRRWIAEDI
nr:hypothetical protein [Tanacetum cinerariifolium]